MTNFLELWSNDLASTGPFSAAAMDHLREAVGRLYLAAGRPTPRVAFSASPAALRYTALIASARYAMSLANTGGIGEAALAAEEAALDSQSSEAAGISDAVVAATWSAGMAPVTTPNTPPPWATADAPILDIPVAPSIIRSCTRPAYAQIAADALEAGWHAVRHAMDIDSAGRSADASYYSEHVACDIARRVFVGERHRVVRDAIGRTLTPGLSRARLAAACSMGLVSPSLETTVRHGGEVHFGPAFVVISSPPIRVERDDRGRLSNREGPAVKWADGSASYAVDGNNVPGHIIEHPDEITDVMVSAETNPAIRDLMLELYPGGYLQYLEDAGMVFLDGSVTGALYVSTLGAPKSLLVRGEKLIVVPREIRAAYAAERWHDATAGDLL